MPPNEFGKPCPQLVVDQNGNPQAAGDEDCLFLNVFRPAQTKAADMLPVMVWFPGGCGCGEGAVMGAPPVGAALYDPARLVEKGVIVVTLNYRIGVLGRFAHPALDVAQQARMPRLSANYGLMDQQFALEWVKANVHLFGGDKDKVTIFGESQGGISVYAHLVSPRSTGLFWAAIAQSGAVALFQPYPESIVSLKKAEEQGELLAATVAPECVTSEKGLGERAECLRKVSVANLVKAQKKPNDFVFPIMDGVVLPIIRSGHPLDHNFVPVNKVPVISGSNHDEHRTSIAMEYDCAPTPKPTPTDLQQVVPALLDGSPNLCIVKAIIETEYSLPRYGNHAPTALGDLGTDMLFACPARKAAQRLVYSGVETYFYEFNDDGAPSTFGPCDTTKSFPKGMGAPHFSEVQYLFDIAAKRSLWSSQPLTGAHRTLSEKMINYWTRFAKTRNPNTSRQPPDYWPAYTEQSRQIMSLVAIPGPHVINEGTFDDDHECSWIWDRYPAFLFPKSTPFRCNIKTTTPCVSDENCKEEAGDQCNCVITP